MKKVIFLFLIIITSCSTNNNPVIPEKVDDPYNKLLIETDSLVYNWQQGEQGDYILLYGTLINEADTVFYSKIGGFYGGGHYFSGHSDAFLEKFDSSENVWTTKDIAARLYEGPIFVPLQPFENLSFSSHLTKKSDQNESGTYRFKLNYYNQVVPMDSNVTPYFDYSNEFVLK